jgi:SecD/SecF fusion protein
VDSVRTEASRLGESKAVIQGVGKKTGAGSYQKFQIQMRSLSGEAQNSFQQDLHADLNASSVNVKNVSASFSNQILQGALYAIIASLLLIVLYIIIRFQWQFAIPVLVALLHDMLLTLGVYSLSQREVTTSTVAAVLTILGYSIYDTIIVFDRVRENIPLLRHSPFADIANRSLWETIRRSLTTTFITLLPVGALLIFGGSTLKDFAFALAIGITSGAYSTIFIATPLLNLIKRREKEYVGRKPNKAVKHEVHEVAVPSPFDLHTAAIKSAPEAAPATKTDASTAALERRKARAARRRKHGRQ